jgi:hypothetical protein
LSLLLAAGLLIFLVVPFFLSNCVLTQGLGYFGLQTAGVPGFQRIRLGDAGFPNLLTFIILLDVSDGLIFVHP